MSSKKRGRRDRGRSWIANLYTFKMILLHISTKLKGSILHLLLSVIHVDSPNPPFLPNESLRSSHQNHALGKKPQITINKILISTVDSAAENKYII